MYKNTSNTNCWIEQKKITALAYGHLFEFLLFRQPSTAEILYSNYYNNVKITE